MIELDDLRGIEEGLKVDTSEKEPVYMVADKGGSYIRLSPSAYHLLRTRKEGYTFEELSEALSKQKGKEVSPDEVEKAYHFVVKRIVDIRQNHKEGSQKAGFWLRLPLIKERFVGVISERLAVAYHPLAAVGLLGLMAVILVLGLQYQVFTVDSFTTADFWTAYALFIASLIVHEFGHSSACARYGARPSDIGFTFYLIYPAFYSDVSAAWELKKWQRVIVDLGGTYFQFVAGAVYIIAYLYTGWTPLQIAILLILGGCLFSLNPVLKFDGYWVVADALGVTNLSKQPKRIFRYLRNKLMRKPTETLPWSGTIVSILAVYSVLSVTIWGGFLILIVMMLWQQITIYPTMVAGVVTDLFTQPELITKDRLVTLLTSTYFALLPCYVIFRMAKPKVQVGWFKVKYFAKTLLKKEAAPTVAQSES